MKISLPSFKPALLALALMLSPSLHASSSSFEKSMYVTAALPAIGGVYAWTIDDYEGIKELTISCLVTAQLVTLMKNSFQRSRPNNDNDLSFPSGHSAAAFMGASFMGNRYGLAWGIPMYALASVIAVQRVNVDDHYWSDIIAGAALGWATAWYFTANYPDIRFEPQIDPATRTYGMRVSANFG